MATLKETKSAGAAGTSSVQIHEVAYYHWEERGRPCGSALDDWLYAESVLTGAPKKKPAVPRKKAVKAAAA